MNREQLRKDIFPAELILKLFGNETQLPDKLKLINGYIEEVRDSFDEDVLKIIKNNQIAHIYWMSNLYPEAITYFEIVVENMEPEDQPSLYFLALNLLIRGNRLLSNYEEAEKWAELAFENHHLADAISKLHILNDYSDVLSETEKDLEKKYYPLIQSIIDEYGFPEKLEDPIATIRSMNKTHKYWNNKLSGIRLKFRNLDRSDYIKELEQYIDSCEIEWYRNYVQNTIEKLKNKNHKAKDL